MVAVQVVGAAVPFPPLQQKLLHYQPRQQYSWRSDHVLLFLRRHGRGGEGCDYCGGCDLSFNMSTSCRRDGDGGVLSEALPPTRIRGGSRLLPRAIPWRVSTLPRGIDRNHRRIKSAVKPSMTRAWRGRGESAVDASWMTSTMGRRWSKGGEWMCSLQEEEEEEVVRRLGAKVERGGEGHRHRGVLAASRGPSMVVLQCRRGGCFLTSRVGRRREEDGEEEEEGGEGGVMRCNKKKVRARTTTSAIAESGRASGGGSAGGGGGVIERENGRRRGGITRRSNPLSSSGVFSSNKCGWGTTPPGMGVRGEEGVTKKSLRAVSAQRGGNAAVLRRGAKSMVRPGREEEEVRKRGEEERGKEEKEVSGVVQNLRREAEEEKVREEKEVKGSDEERKGEKQRQQQQEEEKEEEEVESTRRGGEEQSTSSSSSVHNSSPKSSLALGGTAIGLGIVVGAVALVAGVGGVFREQINSFLITFSSVLDGMGLAGYVLFIFVYAALEVLAIPAIPLTMTAGLLFGVVLGTVLVSIASTIAATVAFLIARYVARDKIVQLTSRYPKFAAIDKAIGKDSFRVVTLLRLSPLLPFSLGNYLYGLTSVRLLPYVLGSWIGMLPGTWAYVSAGSVGRSLITQQQQVGGEGSSLFSALGGGGGGGAELWALALGVFITLIATTYVTGIAKDAIEDMDSSS